MTYPTSWSSTSGRTAIRSSVPPPTMRSRGPQKVLEALPAPDATGLTMDELVVEAEARRTTVRAVVDALLAEKLVAVHGAGKRGDPYRYTVSGIPVPARPGRPPETAKLVWRAYRG